MGTAGNWLKSWKLLSWRTTVVVVIAVHSLVGFFGVPVIAKTVIVNTVKERTGRDVTVGEVKCNPFSLSLTVRDVSFPDRPGSTMLSFDEFYANAQISSLFRWAATLKELRVENPYIGIRRFADGGINVLELMDELTRELEPIWEHCYAFPGMGSQHWLGRWFQKCRTRNSWVFGDYPDAYLREIHGALAHQQEFASFVLEQSNSSPVQLRRAFHDQFLSP